MAVHNFCLFLKWLQILRYVQSVERLVHLDNSSFVGWVNVYICISQTNIWSVSVALRLCITSLQWSLPWLYVYNIKHISQLCSNGNIRLHSHWYFFFYNTVSTLETVTHVEEKLYADMYALYAMHADTKSKSFPEVPSFSDACSCSHRKNLLKRTWKWGPPAGIVQWGAERNLISVHSERNWKEVKVVCVRMYHSKAHKNLAMGKKSQRSEN